MLVLGRREWEEIVLTCPGGERVTITITHAHGGKARLGFVAPESVRIDRKEVREHKDQFGDRGLNRGAY
jgi:carbon storage regulator CsrA